MQVRAFVFKLAVVVLLCWVISLSLLPVAARQGICQQAEPYHQFDFWVGEWDVTSQGQIIAQSKIQKIVASCLVLENYTQGGGSYVGKSMNFYDSVLGKWRQTYIDNTGRVAEFVGEYKEESMRFEGEGHLANGQKRMIRMTFYNLGPDKVRQQAENSADSGKTWRTVVDLLYVRRKEAK